jgi:lipoprotein NlpD
MRSRHSDLRETLVRRAAPLATGLLLAACAASPPAPIVSRTGSASTQPTRPGVPPAAAAPAAPAAAPAPVPTPAPEAPVVQTAPVRSGSVESRSAASTPPPGAAGAPGPTPPVAASPPVPAVASAPVLPPNARTGPRGTKVPFTDSALAELRAAESGPAGGGARAADPRPAASSAAAAAAAPGATPAAPAATSAEPKAADGEWAWPSSGRVLQSFDQSSNKGIALAGKPGDPVLAAADGRVIFSGNGPRGYGNLVIVKHQNDLLSVYAHNRSLAVKEGQAVRRGQKIAELGDSGTTSPRLHFEIRQQGKPVDPAKFLPKR